MTINVVVDDQGGEAANRARALEQARNVAREFLASDGE